MKPEQFIMMIVMVAVLLSAGGCSRLMGGNGTVTRVVAPVEPTRVFTPVERTFAAALQQLRAGNESAAIEAPSAGAAPSPRSKMVCSSAGRSTPPVRNMAT